MLLRGDLSFRFFLPFLFFFLRSIDCVKREEEKEKAKRTDSSNETRLRKAATRLSFPRHVSLRNVCARAFSHFFSLSLFLDATYLDASIVTSIANRSTSTVAISTCESCRYADVGGRDKLEVKGKK